MDIEDASKACCSSQPAPTATVDHYHRHIFISLGSREWDGNAPSSFPHPVVSQLTTLIKSQKKLFKLKVSVNGSDLPNKTENPENEIQILSFPENVIYGPINLENVSDFVDQLKTSEDASAPLAFPHQAPSFEKVVVVCAHNAKDERCGKCGPLLIEATQSILASENVQNVAVLASTHVGGHKYAGNVILFPGGDWYGYVTVERLPQILQTISIPRPVISTSPIVADLWRGRIGLTKPEQQALFAALQEQASQ
eukprot:TRINITY_DN9862_c0_g1_i1.p1 TRINITY_DN9862_c0_g1~~TRINITY_DN9862_c0_g1_i1.p1  ORF type:complete len:253 (+),score=90.50 TRINITY_DN9862_c0_g1_i1:93-851(+)